MTLLRRIDPSGNILELKINITEEDFRKRYFRWKALECPVEEAFPDLTTREREFLCYGDSEANKVYANQD